MYKPSIEWGIYESTCELSYAPGSSLYWGRGPRTKRFDEDTAAGDPTSLDENMDVDESGAWMDVEDDRRGGVNFEALVAVARAASPPRTRSRG